jgi:2-polyprenyl-3-methyl-5-hydroxy-6-metoxy-1,4-benzoquinol methylase
MQDRSLHSYNVRKYFDLKAPEYFYKSRKGLWRIIRQREKSAVLKMLDPAHKDFILDAGCGTGYYLSALLEHGFKAEGIDFSYKMVEEARKRGFPARVVNLEENINVTQRYDKIICAGVLEFCDNDKNALMNLKNILRPEGVIILLIPKLSFTGLLYKLFHRCGCGEKINLYSVTRLRELANLCNFRICDMVAPTPYSLVVKLLAVR